jgi:catechol 2,3-dioxygenase-like lactoylglutathione lyase family enzyme
MGIKAIDHLSIHAADMQRTLEFYRGLGLEIAQESGASGHRPVIKVNEEQKINVLPRPQGGVSGPSPRSAISGGHFCFAWEGTVQEALELLRRRGVAVDSAPSRRQCARGPATSVYFHDPEGNQIELAVYQEE